MPKDRLLALTTLGVIGAGLVQIGFGLSRGEPFYTAIGVGYVVIGGAYLWAKA